jgi:hypothetical protein
MILLIPTRPATNQFFKIALKGVEFNFNLRWNEFLAAWILDIRDSANRSIINGIPLEAGRDLLSQFKYMKNTPQGRLWVTSKEIDFNPTFWDLGINSFLYFLDP